MSTPDLTYDYTLPAPYTHDMFEFDRITVDELKQAIANFPEFRLMRSAFIDSDYFNIDRSKVNSVVHRTQLGGPPCGGCLMTLVGLERKWYTPEDFDKAFLMDGSDGLRGLITDAWKGETSNQYYHGIMEGFDFPYPHYAELPKLEDFEQNAIVEAINSYCYLHNHANKTQLISDRIAGYVDSKECAKFFWLDYQMQQV